MTYTQKHTHLQTATSHHADQSLQKSVFFSTREEFYFFSPSLRCFNFFSTHSRHDKTAKATTGKGHSNSTGRTPAGNTGLAKVAVQCFVGQFCGYINFSASYESLVLINRHLRQARKR